MKPWSAILFDLDGTIADSAPGITSSLAHTFETLGLPVPSPAELVKYVGPPLLEAFEEFEGFTRDQAERALQIYRAHYYEKGALDSTIFPGMPEVLAAVHDAGIPTSLATSKPEYPATMILDHAGLTGYLDIITGASEDEVRSAKKDVVEEALRRLRARGVDLSNPVLIGDRHHDVEGAAVHGVPTIFVEWGYGSPAEQVGAVDVVSTPSELADALGVALEEKPAA
ncbi:HAD hydrolase-like protein [Herbiconiux sp. SYSU D00978]|uniref:HAD hydrolase-like protein n=1 Tax=Herbiconiux sp. SYSU D00978 TaxID=2812562 RepID=UPI001A960943|nr:HAD hydrolase-like protein [Herbiconiux sp. SYSU D00978]